MENLELEKQKKETRGLERNVLDFVAAVSPWLAPLIPTYFAAYNAYYHLAKGHAWFDVIAVVVIALVVETIGLAGVHTAIQFWNWNRTKLKTDDGAPLEWAVGAVIFYILIVILVNALLDFFAIYDASLLPYIKIIAVGMLSLLAINSALIVALRAGQADRESRAQEAKNDRKLSRNFQKLSNDENVRETGEQWRPLAKTLKDRELLEIVYSDPEAVAKTYGKSLRGAQNWSGYARAELLRRGHSAEAIREKAIS